MTDTPRPACDILPEPPPGMLVHTTGTNTSSPFMWQRRDDGAWRGAPILGPTTVVLFGFVTLRFEPWHEVAGGRYGDVELLVRIPYNPPGDTDPGKDAADQLVEAIAVPALALIQRVTQGVVSGVAAVQAHHARAAYERGRADQAAHDDNTAEQ